LNQIFLGLIKSHRPDALIEVCHELGHPLENELCTIEQKVRDIFHHPLTVRELVTRVHEVAIIKNIDHPRENCREEQLVYLTWLWEHWREAEGVLRSVTGDPQSLSIGLGNSIAISDLNRNLVHFFVSSFCTERHLKK
jgi:hypothetical protein